MFTSLEHPILPPISHPELSLVLISNLSLTEATTTEDSAKLQALYVLSPIPSPIPLRFPPMSTATDNTLMSAAKAMLCMDQQPQEQQYHLALSYLEWVLNIKSEDLCNFEAMVQKEYGSALPAPTLVTIPIPRQPVELRKQPAADCANTNPYPPQSPLLPHSPPLHFNSTSRTPSTCQTPPSADLVRVPAKDVVPIEQSLHTLHPECGSSMSQHSFYLCVSLQHW
ncbi:hypothetical protein FRC06_010278 [Ceratobasidium sp. 370]|nr:hypothetical protein FRC06_010278 [Ceratobasidium sp. 370]